jgi:uncharacterized protein (DUF58 family)
MSAGPSSPARLDPLLIARLAGMELRARYVVEGAWAGRHRSRLVGHSLEYSGHRPYSPGDERRHIDWNVFAKTDRWTVRERQAETDLRAVLLLDVSRSMSFASPGRLPKRRYAAILLAALCYLLIRRRESVGLGFFDDGLRDFTPVRGGAAHLAHLLDRLEGEPEGGRTDLARALSEAGQRLPRRSLVLVASDFLQEPEAVGSALKVLSARKHEVMTLQVLDPAERDLGAGAGDSLFEDLETGETLRTDAGGFRREYRRRMDDRLARLDHVLSSLGADAHRLDTATPLDEGLTRLLERRESRRAAARG